MKTDDLGMIGLILIAIAAMIMIKGDGVVTLVTSITTGILGYMKGHSDAERY